MASKTMPDLFVARLQDAYSAETQLAKALPRLARAANSSQLRSGFEAHLKETEGHVKRLESVCQQLGCKASGEACAVMKELIAEGQEVIDFDAEGAVRDAWLIVSAQKVEHYEIVLYGGLCALAKQLGKGSVASTLSQTLEEEKRTDQKLTQFARSAVNRAAASLAPALS